MGKFELEVVQEKLAALQQYYQELKELGSITFKEYCSNNLYKRTAERLIQLIVEAATDINNVLLKTLDKGMSPDYFSSFIKLAEAGVITIDFALEIAPSTGLRNIIVHEYQRIDDSLVYDSIQETLKYYLLYMKQINDYINRS
ncbi:type VII toxin-antitoxin system HepT family RNase toxin [Candidatus Contubernalis alkaliaceticus]|uniref:type VII toxin-antitoxin system HepT family RNase toxin n=1 Tax=Candidatus Contubernalis alkaliaceticus TaxID=338645 RepID=UPI001F4BDE03|nr:DUF86 domain-containing protein [Candidatus Contubernalis alkalaceticus]UNC90875.1 DUF86 domain-containing protein [Candidatus Contubernalis alkalaceticus]